MAISNSAIVILGASGDLAKRKLIPALARLYEKKEIDDTCRIIGSGRTTFTDEEFRDHFHAIDHFCHLLHYHRGIKGLRHFIHTLGDFEQVVFFMALPPKVYALTAFELREEGFTDEARLIIEKPFGYDERSARVLNEDLHKVYREDQIYRIDHYLAKEAVQNILVFRFANPVFAAVWNGNSIESIQISAFEDIGVENRGQYFDSSGTIRDMVQNHLMQLLCLMTMEPPVSLDAEDIRAQKVNVLKALQIEQVQRYQYEGYRTEPGIEPESETETYAEIKCTINNFRWLGMPIYIRVGKAVHRKGTEIGVRFKPLPRLLFNEKGDVAPNQIVFNIQPAEGIIVDLASKLPGNDIRLTNTNMSFCYRDSFDVEIPEAYQKLLLDALKGDRTLFVSAEETELSWRKIDPWIGRGDTWIYRRGRMPNSALDVDWIDFDAYGSACQ